MFSGENSNSTANSVSQGPGQCDFYSIIMNWVMNWVT